MKTIIYFLGFLFLLSSCSSSSIDTATINSGLDLKETSNFSLQVPSNWNVLSGTSSTLPNPKNGEITFASTSNELKYGFSSNIVVLTQKLDKLVSSREFSILNNVGGSREFLEYKKIESKNIVFADKDIGELYIFEARYNLTTPKLKFLQTGKVCSPLKGHLITMAISADIKDTSKYEQIINTFQCK